MHTLHNDTYKRLETCVARIYSRSPYSDVEFNRNKLEVGGETKVEITTKKHILSLKGSFTQTNHTQKIQKVLIAM